MQTLLDEVPGQATPDLAGQMLLGHAFRLIAAGAVRCEQVLLRLYSIARLEALPDGWDISGFEDRLSLARDKVFGTVSEVTESFAEFLATFEPYAPDISTGNI